MNSSAYLQIMYEQAEWWRLVLAAIIGIVVGFIYFQSLRWSVNHLAESKHKFGFYGLVALMRIILFFGALVLISNRNVIVILIYVITFFITKMVIMIHEKDKTFKIDDGEDK